MAERQGKTGSRKPHSSASPPFLVVAAVFVDTRKDLEPVSTACMRCNAHTLEEWSAANGLHRCSPVTELPPSSPTFRSVFIFPPFFVCSLLCVRLSTVLPLTPPFSLSIRFLFSFFCGKVFACRANSLSPICLFPSSRSRSHSIKPTVFLSLPFLPLFPSSLSQPLLMHVRSPHFRLHLFLLCCRTALAVESRLRDGFLNAPQPGRMAH